LTHLHELVLDHTAFSGDISTLIGSLLYLKHMHLNNNMLAAYEPPNRL